MSLVIATTTRYPSVQDLRCQLALAMIHQAVKVQGFDVVIVDGSPQPNNIRSVLKDAGAIIFEEAPASTMGASRRQALTQASRLEQEVIIWMEPEKEPLVSCLAELAQPILNDQADIAIPSRSEAGLASYPRLQRLAEECGNETFKRVSGLTLDVWFGPRLMNRKGVKFFLEYDGKYGDRWDSIFIPLLRAHAAGLKILNMPTQYLHPQKQTQQEEKDMATGIVKRLEQLQNLITALCQEAIVLKLI